MHGKKKKLIKEMELEVEELIAKSGQSEDNIHTNYNAYLALKKREVLIGSFLEKDEERG